MRNRTTAGAAPPASPKRGLLALIFRVIAAVAVTLLCWFGAIHAFFYALWEIHPWAGQHGERSTAAAYVSLLVASLMAPSAAWRVLVPRTRWWGAVVFGLITVAVVGYFVSLIV
ncbi:hypothetical protein [Actinoplanes sp. NPDC049118]|uniref:hypothetical protein n=1 Tax=Actinoplanes sp. NPDC049118 TaxID=3155769 RepID=UPI0033FAA910